MIRRGQVVAPAGRNSSTSPPRVGVEDISAGMGVTWGDYNNDGLMDVYISNMFSSAGGRIAYQRRFRRDDSDETLAAIRRHARGNTLFENQGDGTMADVSVPAAVTMGRWAWGAKFLGPQQRRTSGSLRGQWLLDRRPRRRLVKFLLAAGRVAITHRCQWPGRRATGLRQGLAGGF